MDKMKDFKGYSSQIKVEYIEDGVMYVTNLKNIKGPNLQVGDARIVKWSDNRYYPAKVISLGSDGRVEVKYTEDKVKFKTHLKNIKGGSSLQVGDRRMVKWKDNRYYPAIIIGVDSKIPSAPLSNVAQSCVEGGPECSAPVAFESDDVAQSCAEGGPECSAPVAFESDDVAQSCAEGGPECSAPVAFESDDVAQSCAEGGPECSAPVAFESDDVAQSCAEGGPECSAPVAFESDDVAQSCAEGSPECSSPVAFESDDVAQSCAEGGPDCSAPVAFESDDVAQSCAEGGPECSAPVAFESDDVAQSCAEGGPECSAPVAFESDDVAQSCAEGGPDCSAPFSFESDDVAQSCAEGGPECSAPVAFESGDVAQSCAEGGPDCSAPVAFESGDVAQSCAEDGSEYSAPVAFESDDFEWSPSVSRLESRSPSSLNEAQELQNVNIDSPPSSLPSSLYDSDRDPEYIPSDSDEDILSRTLECQFDTTVMQPEIVMDSSDDENDNRPKKLFKCALSTLKCKQTLKKKGFFDGAPDTQQPSTSAIVKMSSDIKSKLKTKKRIREKDLCFYCDTMVLNFGRHLQRNHSCEIDVQEFMAKSPNSKERKQLIEHIRKKGNYVLNTGEKCVKPVRKSLPSSSDHKCLPCIHCLGFFSRKNLYRHRKICSKNPSQNPSTLGDAQSFLSKHVAVDPKLKMVVFPHMQANEKSFVAKKDELICSYGARYLKTHKGKHHVPVCSRKMQELARLLIEVRKIKPEIKSMIEAIRPENYDAIVQATKNAASYDEETETFKSPSYAMNIGKTLKDCCDIAITLLLKGKVLRNTTGGNITDHLKTTIQLIESNWQYDISSQAATNLNVNRWNKITIVPLASDIKLFKEYLERKGNTAAKALELSNTNETAFRQLVEVCFARTLLLNRKRPGELQRMDNTTYDRAQKRESYEEFGSALTPTEKLLVKRFKRVVIEGKRKRGVPVLFPVDVQEHISLIKKVRPNFFHGITNPYLFATPKCQTPICGYKVLRRLALESGAKNPAALSATRLRKHLATINQILHLSDNDVEQLATFMGHTEKIHRGEYRLPDDVYQTAKVCKLLLMMESGEAAKHSGQNLTEITIDMEEELQFNNNDFQKDELDISVANEDGSLDIMQEEHEENIQEAGVNDDGEIQYLNTNVYSDSGSAFNDPVTALFLFPGYANVYDSTTWGTKMYDVKTDKPCNIWARAPGTLEAVAMAEHIIEHIAHEVKKDPLSVRMQNLDKTYPLDNIITRLKEKSEYESRKASVDDFNKNNLWKKRGISLVLMRFGLDTLVNFHAMVSIYRDDGTVAITHGGVEMGQGINTKAAQVCASAFNIPLESVRVKPVDNVSSPNCGPTGGSFSTDSVCYAVEQCCIELNKRLAPFRAGKALPWLAAVQAAYLAMVNLNASYMFSPTTDFKRYNIFGATVLEVEVDILTGEHKIVRVDILEDAGKSLNQFVDIGQIEGAFIMGLGVFTSEEVVHDPLTGRVLTNRTLKYHIPGPKDIPIDFRVYILKNSDNPLGVLRSKAVGEPPLCMSCSYMFAVRQALGSARRDLGLPDTWLPLDSPFTDGNIVLNSGIDAKYFTL